MTKFGLTSFLVFSLVFLVLAASCGGESSTGNAFEIAQAAKPEDIAEAIMHFNDGVALDAQGRYEESIPEYTEAIRLSPDASGAYLNRGIASFRLGQYQQAIEDYGETLKLSPQDAVTHNARGQAYGILGEFELAIQDLNQAIVINPQFGIAYSIRGTSYLNRGLFEGDIEFIGLAVDSYDDAIRLISDPQLEELGAESRMGGSRDQRLANAYDGRGRAHFMLGQLEAAIHDLNEATRLNAQLPLSYAIRARALTLLGNDQVAQEDVESAVALGMDRTQLETAIEEIRQAR